MEHQKAVAIIVAHPDDEILWCGGTIINHPEWQCFIACLCRKNDPDRAPKFYRVLNKLHAKGIMGDLDDGPGQTPLADAEVKSAIKALLPASHFDLVITHSPTGEYTRHRRHEEISRAVIQLWHANEIDAAELWAFAFEDGLRQYRPRAIATADLYFPLTDEVWKQKYTLINTDYNFSEDGWETRTTPIAEAFWRFTNAGDAMKWLAEVRIL